MPRIMGDAIHANVGTLPRNIDMTAGYDTGTPDIKWTDPDWAEFPGIPHVHIDQGFGDTRAIEAHVLVFDIEIGAFHPDQAVDLINANNSPRPTIYVNQSNMAATIASAQKSPRWKGDIWLAFPGWRIGDPLPPIPHGTQYVAIQNNFQGVFDTSAVLDNAWPHEPGFIVRMEFPPFGRQAAEFLRAHLLKEWAEPGNGVTVTILP